MASMLFCFKRPGRGFARLKKTTMAPYIPLDIVEGILLRLPVKSLLRFRCVSKATCELISHPHFVKTHLHLQHTLDRTRICIVESHHYILRGDFIFVVRALIKDCEAVGDDNDGSEIDSFDDYYDSLINGDDEGEWLRTHSCVSYSLPDADVRVFKFLKSRVKVMESCNGLIFIVDGRQNIALWNPSTRQCNRLPQNTNPNIRGNYSYFCDFAFVYDSIKDDYKIIQASTSSANATTTVDVFSLKSYDWRSIEERPNCYSRGACCSRTFINGAIHWIARPKKETTTEIITAFDVEKGEFRRMGIPSGSSRPCGELVVMEGCLGVYFTASPRRVMKEEFWVMKEYGDESSWTRIFPYTMGRSCELVHNLNDKHLLLVNQKNLVLFDERENRYKNILPCFSHCHASLFVESLVSPFQSYMVKSSLFRI